MHLRNAILAVGLAATALAQPCITSNDLHRVETSEYAPSQILANETDPSRYEWQQAMTELAALKDSCPIGHLSKRAERESRAKQCPDVSVTDLKQLKSSTQTSQEYKINGKAVYIMETPSGEKDHFMIVKTLAKGMNGEAKLAVRKSHGDWVVVKQNFKTSSERREKEAVNLEYVGQLLGEVKNDQLSLFAMPFSNGMTMADLFRENCKAWEKRDHTGLKATLDRVAYWVVAPLLAKGFRHYDLSTWNQIVMETDKDRMNIPSSSTSAIRAIDFGSGDRIGTSAVSKDVVLHNIQNVMSGFYGGAKYVGCTAPPILAPHSKAAIETSMNMYNSIKRALEKTSSIRLPAVNEGDAARFVEIRG